MAQEDLRECPKCGSAVVLKDGQQVAAVSLKYCAGCALHIPTGGNWERLIHERYVQLKRAFVKEHGIPLDDNFDGEIESVCPCCKGKDCAACEDCAGRGRKHTSESAKWQRLLDEAAAQLPGAARAQLLAEGVISRGDPPRKEALHLKCAVCRHSWLEDVKG